MWVHATSAGACEPQKPYCGYQGTDAWLRFLRPLTSRMSRHHGAKGVLLGRTSIDSLASESAATNPGPRHKPRIARPEVRHRSAHYNEPASRSPLHALSPDND